MCGLTHYRDMILNVSSPLITSDFCEDFEGTAGFRSHKRVFISTINKDKANCDQWP